MIEQLTPLEDRPVQPLIGLPESPPRRGTSRNRVDLTPGVDVSLVPGAEPFFSVGTPDESGRRIGVLVLHGFLGSPAGVRPWGEYLAERGYAVIVPRLPGHGTHWRDLARTRWPDWYGEAERAFDKLRNDCDEVVVGGLSFGGCLALRLALQRGDEVAGVMLVNPWLGTEDPRKHVLPVLKHLVSTLKAHTNDVKKPGEDEHAYDRAPLTAVASVQDIWRDVTPRLPAVTQPLVLFSSTEDHTIDASSRGILLSKLSSREVEEHWLRDSYHVATLDNDAPLIFDKSLEFIRRVTGP
jgi:carboxylesterase